MDKKTDFNNLYLSIVQLVLVSIMFLASIAGLITNFIVGSPVGNFLINGMFTIGAFFMWRIVWNEFKSETR